MVGDQQTKARLYADALTYKASLPVREDGQFTRVLHMQPFWVHDEDLSTYAKSLEQPKDPDPRLQVKYVSAPTASGKSASVLAAFLKSTETTSTLTPSLTSAPSLTPYSASSPSPGPTTPFSSPKSGAVGFTHYLHLPFHNNMGRCFWAEGKLDEKTAAVAGAAFVLDSISMLLDNKAPQEGVPVRVPHGQDVTLVATELLEKLKDQMATTADR